MPANILILESHEREVSVSLSCEGLIAGRHVVANNVLESLIHDSNKFLEREFRTSLPSAAEILSFGTRLGQVLLGPLYSTVTSLRGLLWIVSETPGLLNLPIELISRSNETFLIEGGHLLLRRATKSSVPKVEVESVVRPGPLRVLFMACSPQDGSRLAFEKEEEAMVKLFLQEGPGIHLEIAESGAFQELAEKVASYRPHIVHLSGHASLEDDGTGYFLFEDERGNADLRPAADITAQIFANSGVGMVFVSGCETARAGLAGLCQALVDSGHIPLALGWGMPVIDSLATLFAVSLFKGLGAGREVDKAIEHARTELLAGCASQNELGQKTLHADFALPRLYAASPVNVLFDPKIRPDPPPHGTFRYTILADNIVGLTEGFVGRRRIIQRTLPVLRDADRGKTVLLLTGIGGAGKSTLATRLANRLSHSGRKVVALRYRDSETPDLFALRLLQELYVAALSLGDPPAIVHFLRGDDHPLDLRLRFAIEVLDALPLLLVLDNLESLMPPPPASPEWQGNVFAAFFTDLTQRLNNQGRVILTCRYVPAGFELPAEVDTSPVLHQPMPDFTEADFFKCVEYDPQVSSRLASGELTRDILNDFYRKLGATPRFLKQALPVLAQLSPQKITSSLASISSAAETDEAEESDDALRQLQQKYFADLFLPDLYRSLPPDFRQALSRAAISDLALPIDGLAALANLTEEQAKEAITAWLRLGLLQKFDDRDGPELYSIYPLQRSFLAADANISLHEQKDRRRALAQWLQECSKADREADLGLHFMDVYFACLNHARKAEDINLQVWAAQSIGVQWYSVSEFRALSNIGKLMMEENRHPEFLKLAADGLLALGEWKAARRLFAEATEGFATIGNLAGEAATWHQLASIDLNEGAYVSARENFQKSLGIKQAIGDLVGEAATWHGLASIDLHEGEYVSARENFQKSLEILKAIGDLAGEAATWHQLASIDLKVGEYVSARENFQKSLKIKQAIGNRAGEAATWHQLASIDLNEGAYVSARENFQKSLGIKQAIGDRAGEAATWHGLASIDLDEGEYVSARENFQKSLKILQAIGDLAGEAATWHGLASIDLNEGEYVSARENFQKSLEILQAIANRAGEASTWHQLASIDLKEGEYVSARENFQKSLKIKQAIGNRAGEAATWHGLTVLCYQTKGASIESIRLAIVAWFILESINSGDKDTARRTMVDLASEMEFGEEELKKEILATVESYNEDRGGILLEAAFPP